MPQREIVASVAYDNVINELRRSSSKKHDAMSLKSTIMDTEQTPKFKTLMQLLNDCGIRALVFCQHKVIIGETLITVVTVTYIYNQISSKVNCATENTML